MHCKRLRACVCPSDGYMRAMSNVLCTDKYLWSLFIGSVIIEH